MGKAFIKSLIMLSFVAATSAHYAHAESNLCDNRKFKVAMASDISELLDKKSPGAQILDVEDVTTVEWNYPKSIRCHVTLTTNIDDDKVSGVVHVYGSKMDPEQQIFEFTPD